jgi:hypothetical protein
MFLTDFLFVLLLAVVFTAFFGLTGGRSAPWPALVWLFLILLLATWALGVWFRPIGPAVRGFYWASFVAAIFVVTLLLVVAATVPGRPRKRSRKELDGVEIRPLTPSEEQVERERVEEEAATSLKYTFWVLIAVALVAVIVHYTFPGLK